MATDLTLTNEQVMHICTVAMDDWTQAIIETYLCFGIDLSDEDCPDIKPSEFRIPEHQWKAICEAIVGPPPSDGISQANNAMNWVNLGPSSIPET